ncbi:MAG: M28 family peptidase [Myxococcota bacterium]
MSCSKRAARRLGLLTTLGIGACSGQSQAEKLTPPEVEVSTNALPQVLNLVAEARGDEYVLSFDVLDDDAWVGVAVFGKRAGEADFSDVSSSLSGDVGEKVAVGVAKSIVAPGLAEYAELELRVTDLEAFRQDVVQAVSADRIRHDVEQLTGVRHHSSPALLEETRRYIQAEFRRFQLQASHQDFVWRTISALNLIGRHRGEASDGGTVIVCAHFDSIATTPGADDNASGTAGVLEAMRVLSQYGFENSIDFIGFDLEEHGLVGSKRYVSEVVGGQKIFGVFNFEMIGYPCRSDECKHLSLPDTSILNIALPKFGALRRMFDANGARYVPDLDIRSVEADSNPNFLRSDHAPFWTANIPALFITDGANFRNPHYHQESDTPETLDFEFARNIVATTVLTVMDLARVKRTTAVGFEL